MNTKIISGNKIVQKIIKDIEELKDTITFKHPPKLVSILVGKNSACEVYCESQKNVCNQFGIKFQLKKFDEKISQKKLVEEIKKLNKDNSVTGIMLNLPLPRHINKSIVQNTILSIKDVEGVTHKNLGSLFSTEEKPVIVPCTAMAVIECIKSCTKSIKGKNVVIIGHSEIVGKPVAMLLLNSKTSSATVTVCHIGTKNLSLHTKQADILVVAVGKPNFVNRNMIKKGVIIIDVGINRVKNKIVGDVNFDDVIDKVKNITPVPGGVGVITPVLLVKNLLNLYKLTQKQKKE
jgi:methylenetetrahydrofolate dehydrogenase (NADP+)/methenyltetrahydrofolate cyclohydrolase